MLKLLIAGLLGVAATAGGWFSGQLLGSTKGPAQDEKSAIVQVSTDMNGAPVVIDGRVQGYIVFKISSEIDKSKLVDPKFDIAPFLIGSAFEAAYRYFDKGIPNIRPTDFPILASMITEIANKRLGDKVVQDIEFEQFNYVASDKIRENMLSKSP